MSSVAAVVETPEERQPAKVLTLPPRAKKTQAVEGRFLRVFTEVDMRNSHDGLAAIAKRGRAGEKGIDVDELKEGQYLLFLNTALTRMKLYASNNVVAYLRSPSGRIDLNTIQLIPRAFQGGRIDYNRLSRSRLLSYFEKKGIEIEE